MQNSSIAEDHANVVAPDVAQHKSIPTDYFSKLPIRFGIVFGITGSLLIMVVIATLTIGVGEDIWRSSRIIASIIMGDAAETGILPIIVGTVLHLTAGAIYGSIFARLVPKLPRPIWIVVGILYGLILWVLAVYSLPLLVDTGDISPANYFGGLLIAHVVFGINLGLAGALYGLSNPRQMLS